MSALFVLRRVSLALLIAVALASTASLTAQIPTRNVNMVSGLVWPTGDPFLQRQNEPSLAASTRNPMHMLGGSNDYRSVDLPIVLSDADGEVGDAWLGLYKSGDGGERWTSTLLPGHPYDRSLEGQTSPIFGYHAAADPVVRAGTNGLMYYAGLAFDRTPAGSPPGKSAIFVARFIDNNNQEAGDPFEYINTSLVFSNPGGVTNVFLDKPWMAVDIPRAGGGTCNITTNNEHGSFTQRLPAGNIYVAFTVKSVDAQGDRWDLYFSRSADCGARFSAPMRISRAEDRVNQGASIVIAPNTGDVYIAWRRIDLAPDGEEDHAIVVAKSGDQGNRWNPPGVARRFPRGKKVGLDPTHFQERGKKKNAVISQTNVSTDLVPFDQGSSASGLAFRTNAYPSMAADGTGRIYLAWTERQLVTGDPDRPALSDGDARILLSNSADGLTWSAPQIVHDVGQLGHQIMPALSFAGGKLMVAYYDLQEDRSAVFTKHIDDRTAFNRTSPDRRHTIDIRVSMATPGATPVFEHSRSVSAYMMGATPGSNEQPRQMQVNPPNLPMFKLGTTPFIGDYIDLAPSPSFVPNGAGGWVYNTAATPTPPVFHVAWTDNRDVKPPFDRDWTKYTPPTYTGPRPDPGAEVIVCQPGWAGGRNQNIYTARITGGLIVGSPQNSKQLNTQFSRAFVVFARNTTDRLEPRVFRMTILNQPPGGRASFSQFPAPPFTPSSEPPLTFVDVTVPRLSSASRTVYVTSSDPHAPVTVDVSEITAIAGPEVPGGLEGTIHLNLDVLNPEVDNPEVDNPEVDNPEVDNAEVYNPEVDNPEVDNPEVDNPEVDNPEVDNPEVDNIVVGNPEVDNPEVDNPEVDNPEVDNPEVDNPEVDNASLLENGGIITDVTWKIRNIGNTTTAYNVNLFLRKHTQPSTGTAQLLIYRVYKTPMIKFDSCNVQTMTQNALLSNIPSPTLVFPGGDPTDQNDPGENTATLWIEPEGEIRVTLRVFDPDRTNNITVGGASIDPEWVPEQDVSLFLQPQPVNTPDVEVGVTEPPVVGADPLPIITVTTTDNAGPGSLREAMTLANAQPGRNTIHFNIAGPGPHVITPLTLLPNQTEAVIIDGSTQPGYAGVPLIEINGNGISGSGIYLDGGGSTVRGLAINEFQDAGIRMEFFGGNGIFGNYIGVAPDGVTPAGNATVGVTSGTDGNVIGGMAALDRNVISANAFFGVLLAGNSNRVEGNYIGPDATGAARIPNGSGVLLLGGSTNVVGGNVISGNAVYGVAVTGPNNVIEKNKLGTNADGTAGMSNQRGLSITNGGGNRVISNLISGNTLDGVWVVRDGPDPAGTEIFGNRIGTNADGTAAIPNNTGITVSGASNTKIGSFLAGRNVISGNTGDGIFIGDNLAGEPAVNTVVRGNYIGLDWTGNNDLGNGFVGVAVVNAIGTTIGSEIAGTGNTIAGNNGGGILLQATTLTDDTAITNNRIGLNVGNEVTPNLGHGIAISTPGGGIVEDTRIGGAISPTRNYIGGNTGAGILMRNAGVRRTAINFNHIGVAPDGVTDVGNGMHGVWVEANANQLSLGTEAANVISGNGGAGVRLDQTSNNSIFTNRIGLNGSGNGVIGNDGPGIHLSETTDIAIFSNEIGGNAQPGIQFTGTNGDFSLQGNAIGTSPDGLLLLGNGGHGVMVSGVAGASTIGTVAQPNRIQHNAGAGVWIGPGADRIGIGPNHIFSNALLEIDLGGDGVTANDPGDPDGGANQLQNYPVISSAVNAGALFVTGSLNSTPSQTFVIRLFRTVNCDASGFGGSQTELMSFSVLTDAAGNAPIDEVTSEQPLGWFITATATDPSGNTSEFSQCRIVSTP
jgi:hypothetical protein